MKRKRLTKNEKGLTVMEVLIAMIILSLSLLTLLNMAMVALDGNDWSNRTTTASQMLQEKLEELRNQPGGPTDGADTINGVARAWTVTDAGNFIWQVDISVNWTDVRNRDHTNDLTAFIKSDSV